MSHLNDTHLSSKSLFLQSDDCAISISDTHKSFYLNEGLNPPADTTMMIALTSFEMPYSYYNVVSERNDELQILVGREEVTINVGSRNFDGSQLGDKLTSLLALYTTQLDTTIKVIFNQSTHKFTFLSDLLPFTIVSTTLWKELGFKKDVENYTSSGLILNAPNMANLSGTSSIFVRILNLGINNYDSRGKKIGVIGKINVNCNAGHFIFYENKESIYYKIQERSLNFLEVQLTDDEGRDLNLNGGEWSMVLTIHYEKTKIGYLDENYLLTTRTTRVEKPNMEKS